MAWCGARFIVPTALLCDNKLMERKGGISGAGGGEVWRGSGRGDQVEGRYGGDQVEGIRWREGMRHGGDQVEGRYEAWRGSGGGEVWRGQGQSIWTTT